MTDTATRKPSKADAEKVEQERRKADEKKRKKARTDYDKLLSDVKITKIMTDTEGWRALHRLLRTRIQWHAAEVLDAEKAREIVQHQEGVKILRSLIASVREPVRELDRFIAEMPLFASEMKTRATWDEKLGRIELKTVEEDKKE